MVKITHIFKTYFPETSGGLEEAIRQYGTVAREYGFEVEVVSIGPQACNLVTPDGITVKFYKKTFDYISNPFSLALARSFRQIIADTDILHFHFPWPTAELLALSHTISKPALVTFHCDIHKSPPLKKIYLPFIHRYLKKMDRICIASSKFMESVSYLAPFREKIEEIPYFFNESRFAGLPGPDPDIVEFTERMNDFVLFTGVLRWYKGLDILLDASKKLDADVVIVGRGDLYDRIACRIKAENLGNVHLMGFQADNNLKWLFEKTKAVVLPSISPAEAFGQILLEGLYFSKPLVSTELGTGTSFVNQHNHTGFVVRPGCSQSLARSINRIIKDRALWERFSNNAFQHYLNHFTAAVQGEKYIRLYRSLL